MCGKWGGSASLWSSRWGELVASRRGDRPDGFHLLAAVDLAHEVVVDRGHAPDRRFGGAAADAVRVPDGGALAPPEAGALRPPRRGALDPLDRAPLLGEHTTEVLTEQGVENPRAHAPLYKGPDNGHAASAGTKTSGAGGR